MEIYKILNNNVVVSRDENNKEVIAMGKGIAFKKKIGEFVDDELIDKVYTLSDDVSSKFKELLSEIPMEHIEFCDTVINYIKLELGKKINDKIYITLCDHIYTSIERIKEGIEVKNVLLWDIKKFYKDEYRIGKHILDMIEERFEIRLSDDEAGFIALHIVNATMDEDIDAVYEITKISQEVLNIVKYYFHVDFDEETVNYYRFITHLKFFAQRLVTHTEYQDGQDDDLLEVIKIKYKNAYACALKIKDYVCVNYHYNLSDEEILYLTIHIERVVYKNK